jgi:thiamine-phosphate pyrophosphorylase
MSSRQSVPDEWLVIAEEPIDIARRLPHGCGLLLLQPRAIDLRQLRNLVRQRRLILIVEEPRVAARVHNSRELRRALLAGTRFIFLSPLFPTPSHPDWKPIPRMRAAALARLGRRRLIALGGMNRRRFVTVSPLGFVGWAGISAWREFTKTISRGARFAPARST